MTTKVEAGQLNVETEVGALAGHIEFVYLRNVTRGTRYREEHLPRTFPCGDRVSATVRFVNDSSSTYTLHGRLEFFDPDGLNYGVAGFRHTFGPGESYDLTNDPVKLNKPGTWKVHAELSD